VTVEELRLRSYPSFTRIVLETRGPVVHRVEQTGPKEARIRILGLGGDAQTEDVKDGFVDEVRLERAGAGRPRARRYTGGTGTIRVSTLTDPHRLVLDVQRPVDEAQRENRDELLPLRTIVLDAGTAATTRGRSGRRGSWRRSSSSTSRSACAARRGRLVSRCS